MRVQVKDKATGEVLEFASLSEALAKIPYTLATDYPEPCLTTQLHGGGQYINILTNRKEN